MVKISQRSAVVLTGNKVKRLLSVNHTTKAIHHHHHHYILSGHNALVLKSEIYAGISFHKVQVFTINTKEFRHIFPWKFKRSSRYSSHFPDWLLLKIAQQTKTCSKLTKENTLELFQLMLFRSLRWRLFLI